MAKNHIKYWNSFLEFFLDGEMNDRKQDVFERARIDNGSGTILKPVDLPIMFWIIIRLKAFLETDDSPETTYKLDFMNKLGKSFFNTHERMHSEWLKNAKVAAFFKNSDYLSKRNGALNFASLKFSASTALPTLITMIFREWRELCEYKKCDSSSKSIALFNEYRKFIDSLLQSDDVFRKVWEAFGVWWEKCDRDLPVTVMDAWARFELEKKATALSPRKSSKLRHYSPAVLRIDYCQFCGAPESVLTQKGMELAAHHLVPLCEGGVDDPKNLIVLCPVCHQIAHERRRLVGDMLKK